MRLKFGSGDNSTCPTPVLAPEIPHRQRSSGIRHDGAAESRYGYDERTWQSPRVHDDCVFQHSPRTIGGSKVRHAAKPTNHLAPAVPESSLRVHVSALAVDYRGFQGPRYTLPAAERHSPAIVKGQRRPGAMRQCASKINITVRLKADMATTKEPGNPRECTTIACFSIRRGLSGVPGFDTLRSRSLTCPLQPQRVHDECVFQHSPWSIGGFRSPARVATGAALHPLRHLSVRRRAPSGTQESEPSTRERTPLEFLRTKRST